MELQIKVFMNVDALKNNQCVIQRIMHVNDSQFVPYADLVRSLKFMYGISSVVVFNIK